MGQSTNIINRLIINKGYKIMKNNLIGFQYLAEEVKICELANIKVKDFYSDIALMVNTQKKTSKMISNALDIPEPDPIFCYGHVKGAEVMGCKIFYPEDSEPAVNKAVINDISEVKNFKVIIPEDNPVILNLIKKAKQFYELTGLKNTITFEGPFTDACFLLGQTKFLMETIDNILLCEELISKVTDAAIEWKKYHDSELGINNPEMTGLIDDSIINIDPKIFEKIVLPNLIKWYESFPAPKRAFHCCGNINNFLEALSKMNLTNYDLMGESVDIGKAKYYLKNTYITQLVDFRIIRDASKSKIEEYVNSLLEKGAEGNKYCIVVEGQKSVPLIKAKIVRDTIFKWNDGRMTYLHKSVGI